MIDHLQISSLSYRVVTEPDSQIMSVNNHQTSISYIVSLTQKEFHSNKVLSTVWQLVGHL